MNLSGNVAKVDIKLSSLLNTPLCQHIPIKCLELEATHFSGERTLKVKI
jgi:hypothetical protein